MTKKERIEMINEVAERTDMTLEEAKKAYSSEKKEFKKAFDGFMKSNDRNAFEQFKEESHRRADNMEICKRVIEMRKREKKELKKQIKEDTKIQKKIEKNQDRIDRRNRKIVELSKKMTVNTVNC